jgi:hypothetical protein
MARKKVVFARINRRRKQATLDMRPFGEDVRVLADTHATTFSESRKDSPPRHWFAADMRITPHGDYLVGTLGYSEELDHIAFDTEAWSWVKGETRRANTGNEQTVVPFAVDLHAKGRWVAFATASRMTALQCRAGLEHVLREAVHRSGLVPADWDVDLITSRSTVSSWLRAHPKVFKLIRTLKFSNPGLDLDGDRQEMRAIGANRKREEFAAPRGLTLSTQGEDFQRKLEGVESGDVEIEMQARGESGRQTAVFKSKDTPDELFIDDYGVNLEEGMEAVLRILRQYVATLPADLRHSPSD